MNYLITGSIMKKILFFMLLIAVAVSCKCEETLTVYTLTEEEKTIPYQLHQSINWVDNNNITHNGSVSNITEDYDVGGSGPEECDEVKYNRLNSYLQFNNFKYLISISKSNIISLVIQEYVDNTITKHFTGNPKDFTTIEFNGETYENAILLKQSVLDGEPFGHMVYSKTNGIEFILFEDGTWYKRVE